MLKQSFLRKTLAAPFSKKAPEQNAPVKEALEQKAPGKKAISAKHKAAIVLGLLGASTGLAFTQVPSEALQEVLPTPDLPLSRESDPPIEPILGNRSLFLTNEIFYRKIEAIAQVPASTASSPSSPNSSAKGTSAKASSSAEDAQSAQQAIAQKDSKTTNSQLAVATSPTASSAANSATSSAASAETAAEQAERVTAAAPPAPKAAPITFTGTTIDSVLEMRVAVAKDVSAIAFSTSNGGSLVDLDGNPLKTLPADTASLAEIGSGIVVDGQPLPSAFWVYPDNGGYVAVGNSWYRGRVLMALRERGLIAVNYVLLGDYLYSVVGTEMSPGWALESLKAQAVAARSYALTHNIHPASEQYFDLDNTQRFQAYKGIAREADSTLAAVQSTAGEFISHDGGIVESLYAASQAIVDDAHKGSGMSQFGAKDLAEQGYSYDEILAHYYPGTELGRIETDSE